jgi:prevent-host-death family protein
MQTVSAYDAKTHFSSLLERAGAGETIVITKHGRAVARLVQFEERRSADDVIDRLLEVRRGARLDSVSMRELVEAGRRH